ncbi:MAG: hypothetical protein WCT03_14775 [Candidatus Obscuribacterales bacterium]
MTTNKKEIKFYADPDIEQWLSTLPVGARSRSAFINKMLRVGMADDQIGQSKELQPVLPTSVVEAPSLTEAVLEAKRFIDSFEIDIIEYDKHFEELEQWKAQSEEQLDELIEWRQAFPDQQLFENLETEDVIAAIELQLNSNPRC